MLIDKIEFQFDFRSFFIKNAEILIINSKCKFWQNLIQFDFNQNFRNSSKKSTLLFLFKKNHLLNSIVYNKIGRKDWIIFKH